MTLMLFPEKEKTKGRKFGSEAGSRKRDLLLLF